MSFSFKGELFKIKFNERAWTEKVDEELQILVHQAAREWMRAVIIHVRVYTGFAKGSIAFATGSHGDLAQYLNVFVPIYPRYNGKPKFYKHSNNRKTEKSPESGGIYAHYNFSSSQHRYRFTFREEITYFLLNEFFGSTATGGYAWQSFPFGSRAFKKYLDLNVKSKIPRIKEFLTKEPVVIN